MASEHDIELTPVIKTEGVRKSAQRLREAIDSALNTNAGKQLDAKMLSLQDKMDRTAKKSQELEASMKSLDETKVPTSEYGELQNELSKTQKEYDDLMSKIREYEEVHKDATAWVGTSTSGVKEVTGPEALWIDDKDYQDMHKQAEELENIIDGTRREMAEMEQYGQAFIPVEATEEYQKLNDQQSQLNSKMRVYVESWNEANERQAETDASSGIGEQKRGVSSLNKSMRGLTSTVRGLSRLIPGMSARGMMSINMLVRGVSNLSTVTKKDLVAAFNAAKAAAKKFIAAVLANPIIAIIAAITAAVIGLGLAIKKVYDETKKELEELGKFAKKVLQSGAKLIGKLLKELVKSLFNINKSIGKLAVSGVKQIISKLLSLKSTILENLKLMAQWNGGMNGVNTALSNLTSSLAYLKGALASAFAPILEYIEPILTSFIDKLATVVTWIGMLIAKLTGATTFTKAVRVQTNYAKSLDKVADSAANAEEKLASYDKLQVITNNNSGSGSGSNVGTPSPVGFEKVSLDDFNIPTWGEIIKKANKLGKTLGTKLRNFLNGIDWKKIQDGAKNAATALAAFVNGLNSVQGLGTAVGKTLGELANTIIVFANTLLTKINWKLMGQQFGDAIMGVINSVDWYGLGKIISNEINALADLINGIVDRVDGSKIGKSLTLTLKGALKNINWDDVKAAAGGTVGILVDTINSFIIPGNFKLIGKTLGETFNTIFVAVAHLGDIDWATCGQSIAAAINNFFSTFDFIASAQAISNLAIGFLDMLLTAIDNIDWDKISDDLVNFISNIDWEGIGRRAVEISEKLLEGLQKVWDALRDSDAYEEIINMIVDFLNEKENWERAFKSIKGDVIGDVVRKRIVESIKGIFHIDRGLELSNMSIEFFERLKDNFKDKDFLSFGKNLLAGIVGGILSALDVITGPFQEIFNWIDEGICNIFGIHSPATTMNPIGENIILGIVDGFGLVDFAKELGGWWNTNVAPWFTAEKWSGIAEGIRSGIDSKIGELRDNMSDKFSTIKDNTLGKAEELKEGATDKFKILKDSVGGVVEQLKEGSAEKFSQIKDDTLQKFGLMKDDATTNISLMKDNIHGAIDALKENSSNQFGSLKDSVLTKVGETKDGAETAFWDMKNKIAESFSSLSSAIKSPINAIISGVESMANRVIDGVNGMIRALNKFSFNVPDWVPAIGGKKFALRINTLSNVSLPRLAQGAVIPPNKEFAAILGDQKQGTNIETPLETMIQAFTAALDARGREDHSPIILKLNSRTVAQCVWDEENKRYKQTGIGYSTT